MYSFFNSFMESFNVVVKLAQFFLWCLEVSQDKAGQGYQCHLEPHWEKGGEHDICCCQPNYLFPTCLLQLCRGPANSSYTATWWFWSGEKRSYYKLFCWWERVAKCEKWQAMSSGKCSQCRKAWLKMDRAAVSILNLCHTWQCMKLIEPIQTF